LRIITAGFITNWMPYQSPNQQCQSTEGKKSQEANNPSITISQFCNKCNNRCTSPSL